GQAKMPSECISPPSVSESQPAQLVNRISIRKSHISRLISHESITAHGEVNGWPKNLKTIFVMGS
ncbi:hypothetical protein ACI3L1_14140, partial [Deinococcus sp. SM5_A1]|uniref:hypothetical protein n=1 Tax=Deinococcus sp. SM5_A1 TaxID=3379094 RepID=UPI00385B5364